MAQRDYYELLSVPQNATDAEIKKSYRRLAMKFHPDRNRGNQKAESKFKEINEAYGVLSDSKKRQVYDRLGADGVNSMGSSNSGHEANFDNFSNLGDVFGDVFDNFFGGGGGGQGKRRQNVGESLKVALHISLAEAVLGCKKEIDYNCYQSCGSCDGSGAQAGTSVSECDSCHGSGKINSQQGIFMYQQTCLKCQGQGIQLKSPCNSCSGQGRKNKKKKLSIKIPQGIDDNNSLKLRGEGSVGLRGGMLGDLYVEVRVKEHEVFTRIGDNLHCKIPVPFTKLALGDIIDIPWLDGKPIKLNLDSGTQSGEVLRVKGKGVKPVGGGYHGDLLCEVSAQIPVRLNAKLKEQLHSLQVLLDSGDYQSSTTKKWYQSIKNLFTNSD